MLDKRMTSPNSFAALTGQSRKSHSEEGKFRRPKLLFLAHSFPPASTSGSVRTWNIAKYLTRLGWDIIVVTPHPVVWRKIDNPEKVAARLEQEGIRRILTDHRWRCLFYERLVWRDYGLGRYAGGICRKIARGLSIERGIGWIKATERACKALTPNDVDIILATGFPFAAFRLAQRLSGRLGCPYVLDYRDLWTGGNPHTSHSFRPATIRREARLLAGCAAVTIVSPSWAAAMDRRFGLGHKLHVVTNGYDPDEFADVKPYDFGHFAIVYAGNFYPPKRVISPVMAALRRLKETQNGEGPEWFFHYYGNQQDHVREEAKKFDVENLVVLHGHVSRSTVLSAVRGAGTAVVITSVAEESSSEEQGIIPGKLFEPLGLGTPILLIAPPGGDTETILATTQIGRRFTGGNVDGIVSFLIDAIHGQAPTPKDREAFAWANLASYLDAVLHNARSTA